MNKKEREIILNKYENILIYGDNSTIREFKSLLNMLGLENDKFKIENKVIADKNDLSPLIIDMYDMIINDLTKYNVYCNYLDVEELLYNIEYELTEEELKCNKARINYISEKGKLNLDTIF